MSLSTAKHRLIDQLAKNAYAKYKSTIIKAPLDTQLETIIKEAFIEAFKQGFAAKNKEN